jgi:dolichol-phosphate hexosyltransferase
MPRRKLLSVLIPALNEESGIKQTINAIPKNAIFERGYDLEVIVIDGNSTDLTREQAQSMGARVIVEPRKGYGRAYKTGFAEAKGDIIVTLDADGTYPAELIPEYLLYLDENGLDFITINRFSKMENKAMRFSHKVGNEILSYVMRTIYSVSVKDSQSGMWLMTKGFIDGIRLESDDFSLSEEIKIIAFKFFSAIELDGRYYKRAGKVKLATLKDGWYNLKYLLQYKSLVEHAVMPRQASAAEQLIESSSDAGLS